MNTLVRSKFGHRIPFATLFNVRHEFFVQSVDLACLFGRNIFPMQVSQLLSWLIIVTIANRPLRSDGASSADPMFVNINDAKAAIEPKALLLDMICLSISSYGPIVVKRARETAI
jgi:hypothetical protein